MEAYVINEFGAHDIFELMDLPIPEINAEEKLSILIDRNVFKIHEISDAHLLAESGKNIGKVCLEW
ncbi:MAG: hypothetical protein P4M14_03115 [Gammaproteobacteria bacterium]|nr:hypothetical protein [Gammaproteobacteria bacterium]